MATVASRRLIADARRWAAIYRSKGLQPLPSDPKKKKPLCRYADWWEADAPADLFDRFPTTNVQVMCGRYWDLAVIDLDGPGAVAHFDSEWSSQIPPTWTSYHSSGGRNSRHHWFRLPPNLPEIRKRVVWAEWDDSANAWATHRAIELLCDRSLVMAPPSIHPKTGNTYHFIQGLSPRTIHRPAVLPYWFLKLPPVQPPDHARPEPPRVATVTTPRRPTGRGVSLRNVLDAITDKRGVARDVWGVRFARSEAASDGWVSCHDFNREDRNPSCRFHLETGGFWRPGEKVILFYKIPVEMGICATWQEAADDLAARFSVRGDR